jgi:hypothetical protein
MALILIWDGNYSSSGCTGILAFHAQGDHHCVRVTRGRRSKVAPSPHPQKAEAVPEPANQLLTSTPSPSRAPLFVSPPSPTFLYNLRSRSAHVGPKHVPGRRNSLSSAQTPANVTTPPPARPARRTHSTNPPTTSSGPATRARRALVGSLSPLQSLPPHQRRARAEEAPAGEAPPS